MGIDAVSLVVRLTDSVTEVLDSFANLVNPLDFSPFKWAGKATNGSTLRGEFRIVDLDPAFCLSLHRRTSKRMIIARTTAPAALAPIIASMLARFGAAVKETVLELGNSEVSTTNVLVPVLPKMESYIVITDPVAIEPVLGEITSDKVD